MDGQIHGLAYSKNPRSRRCIIGVAASRRFSPGDATSSFSCWSDRPSRKHGCFFCNHRDPGKPLHGSREYSRTGAKNLSANRSGQDVEAGCIHFRNRLYRNCLGCHNSVVLDDSNDGSLLGNIQGNKAQHRRVRSMFSAVFKRGKRHPPFGFQFG